MTDSNVSISADGRSSTVTYGSPAEPTPDYQIQRALKLSNGDAVKAAALFGRWFEQHSELRDQILPVLLAAYIENALRLAQEKTDPDTRPDFSTAPVEDPGA